MPIITIITLLVVSQEALLSVMTLGFGFGFMLTIILLPVANTILSFFCYPIYLFYLATKPNDETLKENLARFFEENNLIYILATLVIMGYSYFVGSFILLGVNYTSPEIVQYFYDSIYSVTEAFSRDPVLFITLIAILYISPSLLSNTNSRQILYFSCLITFPGLIFSIIIFSIYTIYTYILGIVLLITSLLLKYFYKKYDCKEFTLKYTPLKYLWCYLIIVFFSILVRYCFYLSTLFDYILLLSPNIYTIIAMSIIFKKHMPKMTVKYL